MGVLEVDRIGSAENEPAEKAWIERLCSRFATLEPGEGRCLLHFVIHAFLLMVCYYIVKTLREPLLLASAAPESKSYAYAAVALVLLIVVPGYTAAYRRLGKAQVTQWITALFIVSLCCFYILGIIGFDIGFAYYVWVGVFGVTILAQFWGHAADCFGVAAGHRIFPALMAAATIGGLIGPILVGALYPALGPMPLIMLAVVLLTATLPLIGRARRSVPSTLRSALRQRQPHGDTCRGGFGMVLRDRYLLLLAALVVLLNCINTTGEYLLTSLVVHHASEQVLQDATLELGTLIASFYVKYFLAINILTVLTQCLIVARLFRWIGVHGALLVLPIIVLIGYGFLAFIPILGVLQLFKIIENSADYSVMNTARQALYLPLPAAHKYKGKIAVDTFCYRLGDLFQAGLIYCGLHFFGFSLAHFAVLNLALAVVWLLITVQIARRHSISTCSGWTVGSWKLSAVVGRIASQSLWTPAVKVYRTMVTVTIAVVLGLFALSTSVPADTDRVLPAVRPSHVSRTP